MLKLIRKCTNCAHYTIQHVLAMHYLGGSRILGEGFVKDSGFVCKLRAVLTYDNYVIPSRLLISRPCFQMHFNVLWC